MKNIDKTISEKDKKKQKKLTISEEVKRVRKAHKRRRSQKKEAKIANHLLGRQKSQKVNNPI